MVDIGILPGHVAPSRSQTSPHDTSALGPAMTRLRAHSVGQPGLEGCGDLHPEFPSWPGFQSTPKGTCVWLKHFGGCVGSGQWREVCSSRWHQASSRAPDSRCPPVPVGRQPGPLSIHSEQRGRPEHPWAAILALPGGSSAFLNPGNGRWAAAVGGWHQWTPRTGPQVLGSHFLLLYLAVPFCPRKQIFPQRAGLGECDSP